MNHKNKTYVPISTPSPTTSPDNVRKSQSFTKGTSINVLATPYLLLKLAHKRSDNYSFVFLASEQFKQYEKIKDIPMKIEISDTFFNVDTILWPPVDTLMINTSTYGTMKKMLLDQQMQDKISQLLDDSITDKQAKIFRSLYKSKNKKCKLSEREITHFFAEITVQELITLRHKYPNFHYVFYGLVVNHSIELLDRIIKIIDENYDEENDDSKHPSTLDFIGFINGCSWKYHVVMAVWKKYGMDGIMKILDNFDIYSLNDCCNKIDLDDKITRREYKLKWLKHFVATNADLNDRETARLYDDIGKSIGESEPSI